MPWLACSVMSEILGRRLCGGDVAPVGNRRAAERRRDVDSASPSSDTDPSLATDDVVIRSRMVVAHLEDDVDLLAGELHVLDAADLHARDPHRRARCSPATLLKRVFSV